MPVTRPACTPAAPLALAAIVAPLAGGCVVAADHSYTVSHEVSAVVLDLGKGDVEVVEGLPGEVYVEVDLGGLSSADLGPRLEGDILHLEYRCGGASLCGGDLFVAVPPGVAVDAELGAGSLVATGLSGNLRADLGSGDLWTEGLSSEVVWLATGAGSVEAGMVERPLDADLSVGAGDAWLAVPEGSYRLDLDAGAGEVSLWNVSHDPDAPGALSVHAGAGAVHIEGIPKSREWHETR